MSRNCFLAIAVVLGLLGGLALLASPGSAGPVDPIFMQRIDGTYQVGPSGTGMTDLFLTKGSATSPQVPGFVFAASDLELMLGPGGTVQPSNPATGQATLTLWDPSNTDHRAVFDSTEAAWNWHSENPAQLTARFVLAANTFPDLNLNAFQSPSGGVFALSTTGVTVDASSNTATVASGATATFSLTAVPEPASAVLMLGAGAAALAGLALRRLRRCPAP
jgi:hypothetical protein